MVMGLAFAVGLPLATSSVYTVLIKAPRRAFYYEGPGPRVPEKKATQFIFTVSKHEIHCTLQPEQA